MRYKHLVFGLVVVLSAAGLAGFGHAGDDNPSPSDEATAFAQRTSDLLFATLFAALTQEFDETTVDNVEEGKQSISLVFNNSNKDMRLVGTLDPVGGKNNRPRDAFEETALELALTGQNHTAVQRDQDDDRWYYRRSIALSNFRKECAFCHPNYPPGPTPDWVDALMLRVPITTDSVVVRVLAASNRGGCSTRRLS